MAVATRNSSLMKPKTQKASLQEDNFTHNINIVARQRMLAHKIIMCLNLVKSSGSTQVKDAFDDAQKLFIEGDATLKTLKEELCAHSPAICPAFEVVERFATWVASLTMATALSMDSNTIEHKAMIELPVLVESLNDILAVIEKCIKKQTEARMESIRQNRLFVTTIAQDLQDIGGKINLIALNARIEAARQKESGQAFSIIANEIKSLSDLSRQKASEIAMRLDVLVD